jgi:hypothetical protein
MSMSWQFLSQDRKNDLALHLPAGPSRSNNQKILKHNWSGKIEVFHFKQRKKRCITQVKKMMFSALKTSTLKTFQCFAIFFSPENVSL